MIPDCDDHLYVNLGRERPKIKDISNYVVPKWASKWRQLGRQLNIEKHLMDNIECNYPADCENCCSNMFSKWLDINPSAFWEDVIIAVDNLLSDGKYTTYLTIQPMLCHSICTCYVH